jgi:uncharacterized membrane protein YgcG
MLRVMRRALLIACWLALPFATGTKAQSTSRSIRIRDFGELLTVHPDGSLDVTEELTIGFTGEWHGINRDISLHHNTAEGRPTKLDIRIGYVTDGDGNRLQVEESNKDNGWTHSLKIYIPGAVDTDRQVIIRYRVANAIRFYFRNDSTDAFDELYWNVTGNSWDMPIDSVHARVVLPDGLIPTRTAAYTGATGSTTTRAKIEKDSNEVAFATLRGLGPYEGLTIGVGWPPGHVAGRPSEGHERLLRLAGYSPLLIPVIVFLLMYSYWSRKGRDPKEESFVVHYEPVKGMSPAEAGTLVDNSADMDDITATLVDLAVRGFIHITELTERHLLGVFKNTDYEIAIVQKREKWTGLETHEERYLDSLTRAAPSDPYKMKMSDLRNSFYKFVPTIKNAIYDRLVEAGYYAERPDRARAKAVGFTILGMLVVGGIAVLTLAGTFTMFDPSATIYAAGLSIGILIVFGYLMPARTIAGARAREATLGFKEFLSRVEEDRYKKMIASPELFERYLPYAMAFGVADKWAKAFQDIYREPPQWYSGGTGPFNAISFSQSIGSFSSAASSTMASSPSSSGSGGGGSSGGGSGGGGGSGF